MPEKLLIGVALDKLGIGFIGAVAMSGNWFNKNWFEFVKLGFLILGIVWGVGQTIEQHGQDIVDLKAQAIVDQDEHKAFVQTLNKINTSQELMQYQLEDLRDDVNENKEIFKDHIFRNSSSHILGDNS